MTVLKIMLVVLLCLPLAYIALRTYVDVHNDAVKANRRKRENR